MNIVEEFHKLLKKFENQKYDATGVFVYNDTNTYENNDPHIEECYDGIFIQEVKEAFQSIFNDVLLCPSEHFFINILPELIKKSNVYVYTMAQNIEGYGRRSLIPALCEYYGFTNVNADTYTSVIGVNKQIAFTLLRKYKKYIPRTIYISNKNILQLKTKLLKSSEKVIIKPDCESCCIDVKVFLKNDFIEIKKHCEKLLLKYNFVILQDFKDGDEIGITVLKYGNKYFSLNPVRLTYESDKKYLTNLDSRYGNFTLTPLAHIPKLEEYAIKFAEELNFDGVSRFDFKVCENQNFYLFDISPNPTVSFESSCNVAFIKTFDSDNKGIYQFLAINSVLFKPPFNTTKH